MNKKLNTTLFVIGATVVNIAIMGVLFLAGFYIASRLLPEDVAPNTVLIIFMLIFIGSILGSFFIYHRLVRLISSKVDMEKYFHPIFKPKKKKQ